MISRLYNFIRVKMHCKTLLTMRRFDILKYSIYIIIAAVVMCGATSCNGRPKYKIGVSQCSDDEWRTRMNEEIRREMLFHDDAIVEIRSADDSNEKQIADITYFIDNDFDIIITAPNEADAITPIIKTAYEKGIPIIIFDRNINGDFYTAYMELDNEGIGRSAANYAFHLSGERPVNILEVRGLDGSTPASERHKGFEGGISDHDNLKITHSVSGAWNGDKARHVVDSILDLDSNIDIIYAHNDIMAIAASASARARGLNNIKILGTDAAPTLGIKAVRDSVIDATFIYPTEGGRVIRTAMSILKGENYPRRDYIPALSPVDSTNAEILMRQDELLRDETAKIELLKLKNNDIVERENSQKLFLYTTIFAAVCLAVALILALRFMRQRKRYNTILKDKNEELSHERDRQVELYRQLDEATNSKLAFFTNVSHDLRTPLTLIAGPVSQLASSDYLSNEDKSMMKMAEKNISILRRLIDQILDFRKYQNGKTELNLEETNPLPLIEEWCAAFNDVARNRKLNYKTDIASSGNATMAVDVEKLERIVFNLISNAFKYTPDRGTITVYSELTDSQFKFVVADTGIGISEMDKNKIFDRFYQADKINPNGSGIGLSLSKGFIELMNGTIELTSNKGEGSRFVITIPVSHIENVKTISTPLSTPLHLVDAEFSVEQPGETKFSDSKPLILAIDDNPDILNLIRGILGEKYNIITAKEGKTGLRLALKYIPDLIICDIMMPEMDGLELCEKLKDERGTSHIPVLMLTACKLDEQRMQSYDSGADSFISKPFNPQVLVSRVKNLLLNRKRIKDLFLDGDLPDKPNSDLALIDGNDYNSIESEFYRQFLNIVRDKYTDSSLSISMIASEIGLSATQLSRKIKALTGVSPVDIIRDFRLREARKLVITTDSNFSEIAYSVGFSSPAYLSKCFRDTYGESPTELRTRTQ